MQVTHTLKFSPLVLTLVTSIYASSTLALEHPLTDAKIVATQYGGDQAVTVRWETYDWENSEYTYAEIFEENGQYYRKKHGLFARELGGEYFLVANLKDTSDRTWAGFIPGLTESNPMQLQVREQDIETGEYSSGNHAPGSIVDVANIELRPSFEHNGDQLDLELGPIDSLGSSRIGFDVSDWAFNFSEGYREITHNHVYSVYQIGGIRAYLSDEERGTLFTRSNSSGPAFTDGFSVFQTCNIEKQTDLGWIGACSDEYPVVMRAARSPEHANYPSVTMGSRIDVGSDYEFQEIENWATNMTAGDNATPTSDLRFNTIWVTNSGLFEKGPWISYPSGTLRFQFKEGVSGTSKMYVALSDWDLNSPDNPSYIYQDLAPDHSMIHTVEFTVGTNPETRVVSNGARGSDLNGVPDVSNTLSEGGGGTTGWALFALSLLGLRRRK